jgi:hypothetical protein
MTKQLRNVVLQLTWQLTVGKIAGIDSAGSALVSTEIDSTKSSTGLTGLVESTGHGNPVGSTRYNHPAA